MELTQLIDNVQVAIVVVIAKSTAARRNGSGNARAAFLCDLFKTAIAEIAIEILVLGIRSFGF